MPKKRGNPSFEFWSIAWGRDPNHGTSVVFASSKSEASKMWHDYARDRGYSPLIRTIFVLGGQNPKPDIYWADTTISTSDKQSAIDDGVVVTGMH